MSCIVEASQSSGIKMMGSVGSVGITLLIQSQGHMRLEANMEMV